MCLQAPLPPLSQEVLSWVLGWRSPSCNVFLFGRRGGLCISNGCIIASSSRAAVPDEPEMAQGWEGLSQNSP